MKENSYLYNKKAQLRLRKQMSDQVVSSCMDQILAFSLLRIAAFGAATGASAVVTGSVRWDSFLQPTLNLCCCVACCS